MMLTLAPHVMAGGADDSTPPASVDRKACMTAADEGQKLRDDGKLTLARDQFITCASKSCPSVVSKQCSNWFEEVERNLPTVVFRAKDDQGRAVAEVRVLVDGVKVEGALQARPLPLDPREHQVRFEREDGTSVEEKVILLPGEKNRIVELTFPAPPSKTPIVQEKPVTPPIAPSPGGFRVPLLGWVGAGVLVVGAGTATAFALMANSDESDLRSTCAPHCPESERDGIETKVAIANVGLVVGLIGLGAAVTTTILANTRGSEKTSSATPSRVTGVRLAPGGAFVTF